MLTVKQITLSGIEFLWEAVNVQFMPAIRPDGKVAGPHEGGSGYEPAAVHFNQSGGGDQIKIGGGTVFVMNDHGKTVSRYDLGASEVPLVAGIDPHMTALGRTHADSFPPIVPGPDRFPASGVVGGRLSA